MSIAAISAQSRAKSESALLDPAADTSDQRERSQGGASEIRCP
jgi:hypothetical protein